MWQYLDKLRAAEKALIDYPLMKQLAEAAVIPEQETDPVSVTEQRKQQAQEYMDWMKPALVALNEEDRACLEIYYWNGDTERRCAVQEIQDYFRIERTSAYNKKNRALMRLALLLYGK